MGILNRLFGNRLSRRRSSRMEEPREARSAGEFSGGGNERRQTGGGSLDKSSVETVEKYEQRLRDQERSGRK